MGIAFWEGNQAIAWGAFDAGCRFFAGYPITPATSVMNNLLSLLPSAGGTVIQAEDEIAALGLCLGASMAGHKAMTATSGPGISLMSEHLSFAIGSEIPVVVVDVQRLGPSTGSATRGADGDVQFLRWCHTSGLPVIVLAPIDARDCYALTMRAFNLAETHRCPVFVASNKETGLTRESVDLDSLDRPEPVQRALAPEGEAYLPFRPRPGGQIPSFLPIGGKRISRQTSSTHGEDGYITTSPAEIQAQITRLEQKLTATVEDYTYYDADIKPDSDTLVLTYGASARAARQACQELNQAGTPVSWAVLKTLWPCPEALLHRLADSAKRVLVVEMNQGQYAREAARILRGQTVEHVGMMNGQLIKPAAIKEAVRG